MNEMALSVEDKLNQSQHEEYDIIQEDFDKTSSSKVDSILQAYDKT